MDLYKRRTTPTWAIKFGGDPAYLDEILRGTPYELRTTNQPGVWRLHKDYYFAVGLLRAGEWVVRQQNGDIQVLGNEEFHRTYERVS